MKPSKKSVVDQSKGFVEEVARGLSSNRSVLNHLTRVTKSYPLAGSSVLKLKTKAEKRQEDTFIPFDWQKSQNEAVLSFDTRIS